MTYNPFYLWKTEVELSVDGTFDIAVPPSGVLREGSLLMVILQIKDDGVGVSTVNARLGFNSNTTSSNYDSTLSIYDANGASLNTGEDGPGTSGFIPILCSSDNAAGADEYSWGVLWIHNWNDSSRSKGVTGHGWARGDAAAGNMRNYIVGGQYAPTALITSLQLLGAAGGDLVAGSKVTIYGVA